MNEKLSKRAKKNKQQNTRLIGESKVSSKKDDDQSKRKEKKGNARHCVSDVRIKYVISTK